MNDKKSVPATRKQIDWVITLVPLAIISGMSVLFFAFPNKSKSVLTSIRYVLGDRFGSYYLIIGVLILSISIYMAFSKYGDIVLGGQDEKPKYSFFTWGAMMFTCGLAADILFIHLPNGCSMQQIHM